MNPRQRRPPPAPKDLGQDAAMRLVMPVGRSPWAIAAGYLGLFAVSGIAAPFALFCGIMAILDIRKSKDSASPRYGMGRAIFGIVMGTLFTGVLLLILIGSLLAPKAS